MAAIVLLGILCVAFSCEQDVRGRAWVNDMDDDPDTLVSQWQLPELPELPTIKLHVDSGESTEFALPLESEGGEPDPTEESPVFNAPVPLGLGTTWPMMLVNPGVVTLHGPELFGSLVSGFGMLASNGALDCSSVQCSSLVITDDPPNLQLAEFELVADGPVVVGNDLGSMTLERVRIELRTPAPALISNLGDHVIGAGNAQFVVLGEAEGTIRRTGGSNSTAITLIRDSEGWQTSSFDIGIVDQQGQRWIVNIPAGHWR